MSNRACRSLAVVSLALLFACGRRPQEEYAGAAPTPVPVPASAALPDAAFHVAWGKVPLATAIAAGETITVPVTVTNRSGTTWPDADAVDPSKPGAYSVRLSYRWFGESLKPIMDYRDRVDLPEPLGPGQSVTLSVPVQVPTKRGSYRLQFDLVQELVAWFETKDAETLIVSVNVR